MMRLADVVQNDVSRETIDRLTRFQDLLEKWNPVINLVGKQTIADSWNRHILDSAQLLPIADPSAKTWTDLGSGGGLPAIVISILAKDLRPSLHVTMLESDQRKVAFLRTVITGLGINAVALPVRIENAESQQSDIVSARALAPLPDLLAYAQRHLKPDGQALFPKGASSDAEVEQAKRLWTFDLAKHKSLTNDQASILEIGRLSHV